MIEAKRKVKKEVEVEETYNVELIPVWVVRVVQGELSKKVIAETEYQYEPDEQEIADALIPYINKRVFASVVKNYRLVEM